MKKFAIVLVFAFGVNSVIPVVELDDATPEQIEQSYKKALESFTNRKYNESLDHIRHVIKSDMTNFKLRYLAAHNHWRLGNFAPAEIHFKTAMKARPDYPGTYIDLGLMYLAQNRLKDADELAGKGIKVLSEKSIAVPSKLYNVRARVALHRRNYKSALQYAEDSKSAFQDAKTKVKDQLEAVLLEARSHYGLKNYEAAEFSAKWALSLKPDHVYTLNLLGLVYASWSKASTGARAERLRKEAINFYTKALAIESVPEKFRERIRSNLSKVRS